MLKISDRKTIRSQTRENAGGLNRQDVLILGSDSGEATETARESGSDTCSTKTASEIEFFIAAILKLIVIKQFNKICRLNQKIYK